MSDGRARKSRVLLTEREIEALLTVARHGWEDAAFARWMRAAGAGGLIQCYTRAHRKLVKALEKLEIR